MAKRIAYYGLSSPLFYDYRTEAPKTAADTMSSPNPILDSAFGAMILFDELWFFCESLCPINLRDKPFVKYLDKEIDLSRIPPIDVSAIWASLRVNTDDDKRFDALREKTTAYRDIVRDVGVAWDAAPDNHSHSLLLSGQYYNGNSLKPDNVVYDLGLVEVLRRTVDYDLHLITNSFTQTWLQGEDSILPKAQLSELLILNDVPGYLSREGPYHPCLEEIRENDYLKDFRTWMSTLDLSADKKEILERKVAIEAFIKESMEKKYLEYLDKNRVYKSIGSSVIGTGLDALIPGVGFVKDMREAYVENKAARPLMWQGFVISARR